MCEVSDAIRSGGRRHTKDNMDYSKGGAEGVCGSITPSVLSSLIFIFLLKHPSM